jgi:hypothetical protein
MTKDTSRSERCQEMNMSYKTVTDNKNKDNCRGYKHAPEYGNFSLYNGMLQKNKDTALTR